MSDGTYSASVAHEKIRMYEFMGMVNRVKQRDLVSVLDFRESEARPVHVFQLLSVYKQDPYIKVIDLRSPELWVDFYGSDSIGLKGFMAVRTPAGLAFELRIRHQTSRPFPSIIKKTFSYTSLLQVVCDQLIKNPRFSIVVEDASDDIKLALFQAQCATLHGREQLMTEVETMVRIIQGKDLDRRREGAGFSGVVPGVLGAQAAAAAAFSENHEAGIEAEETLRQQEAAQEGTSSVEGEEMARTCE